jgi:hypothetical protein
MVRFPPPFFITSGAPKQADRVSAAAAAMSVRGFRSGAKNMGVKIPTKW